MRGMAEMRRVSDEYMVAEAVIDVHRPSMEQSAIELGLLDRERDGWRQRQARAEFMGAMLLARSAGLGWPEVVRLARSAAAEVRMVELRRAAP